MADPTVLPGGDHHERRWQALAGICLAAAVVWLAFADFAVVIPTVAAEIPVTLTQLQLANNAFGLTTGVLVLAAGRLCDAYGRRRMLELGILGMGVSSLLVVLVPGYPGLLLSRALMGCAAAFVLPATLALIPAMFSPHEQARAFGAWMGITWIGEAAGPAVGGALTPLFGWRSVFWVVLPLGLAALWLVRRSVLVESRDPDASRHVDVPGLLTSGASFFCLIYGCMVGQERGFVDPVTLGLLGAAVLLGTAFVLLQQRVAEPLFDFVLFSYPSFRGALLANTVMSIVFTGVVFLLAVYFQDVERFSVFTTGLLLFPVTLSILAFIPVGGRFESRRGPRLPVMTGLVLLGAGALIMGALGHGAGFPLVVMGQVVAGAGLGLMSIPMSRALVAGPPLRLAGTASGMFKVSSMLGGAFGVAVFSAAQRYFEDDVAVDVARAVGLSEEDARTLPNALTESTLTDRLLSGVSPATKEVIKTVLRDAQETGTGQAIWLAGLVAVASALALPLFWRPYRARGTE
ncbi:MFS transporter [Streptomyces pacificus]|uniref:MFS transporter n=1 Tax=Streptomyces pacificus TaxID=2705029 RepID=A0A6A0B147_9ACTN|nr:MFS transporter [Streptomyces pacificus]GFH38368.1 MFS transporter [Streptomyces pacificus]